MAAFRALSKFVFAGSLLGGATYALKNNEEFTVFAKGAIHEYTPAYLQPYYLSDFKRRFRHFASQEENGEPWMTIEDFFRSIMLIEKKDAKQLDTTPLASLFERVDANHDGRISFQEYVLFLTLLSTPKKVFETLFKMVDFDGSGTISREEFKSVVRSVTSDPTVTSALNKGEIDFRGGLTSHLFKHSGPDGDLDHTRFFRFVDKLRDEVSLIEFRMYDINGDGTISMEEVTKLLLSSATGSHLPLFVSQNVKKLKGDRSNTIDLETWKALNSLTIVANEVGDALKIYQRLGRKVQKADFKRAVEAVSMVKLTDQALKAVFDIFDEDGDGNLQAAEFVAVMSQKNLFNTKQTPTEYLTIPQCVMKCYHGRG
eukprot:TRINITY_DN62441_c0_g2_i1.p1 TRINITY_DN62441_c0_g2~~TRINITY_DN62441_c0_g2_i1.p1  ORF type:complete len:382 (-),score=38.04 TRINITY_DN62441_c0_g2_i1:635-1747(-)